MHSHLFGEIMDIVPDRLTGRLTTASLIGVVPAKLLIALLLAVEGGIVLRCFGDRWIAAFLGASCAWFVLDAAVLWRDRLYQPMEMRAFLLGWNVAAIATIPWIWTTATLTRLA